MPPVGDPLFQYCHSCYATWQPIHSYSRQTDTYSRLICVETFLYFTQDQKYKIYFCIRRGYRLPIDNFQIY